VIRLVREDDWPSILEVHRAAFGGDDVPRIAAELHGRADLYVPELSFVAEEDGGVVGHVMNTWNWIEETGEPAYYRRFGFVRADELGLLPPPEALYDWALQVAVLEPEAMLPQGRVVYSEPFRH
jgi:predicted N-acetyltransferase YhbS